jgi:diacylglycerol kinase family enzyme
MPPQSTAEREEDLAERILPERAPKRRMLVIVNPHATTVSDRLKNLVVHALRSRYSVDVVDTERAGHATQIAREAAGDRYDVVLIFGGDGTVNEAANGLAGSETPLTALPGGSTNVWCRTVGIPNDVIDATEHLLQLADDFRPRRLDLGHLRGSGGTAPSDDRHFVFASGVGLDASVVARVDAHPRRKARFGAWYYTLAAISIFNRRYLVNPPVVRVTAGERTLTGVTVVVQNSDPFTYFRTRPIRVAEPAGLETGSLAVAVLKRATVLELPTLIPRLLSTRARTVLRHRQIEGLGELRAFRIDAVDDRPFPLQVDGDYVGEFQSATYEVRPGGLLVVA